MAVAAWKVEHRERMQATIKSVLLKHGPLRPTELSQKINKYSYTQIYTQLGNMFHWGEVSRKNGKYFLAEKGN